MKYESFAFPSRRSNVFARHGLVATSQPLAAQVGLDVLRQGGNALDAAIATVATLCVVEPTSTGVGGDAFALIWIESEKRLYGLNASGPAPQSLSAAMLREAGHTRFPSLGPLTVTVPGAVRGWQVALDRFGTVGLDTILAQPIAYAESGFPVSQRIAASWGRSTEKMQVYDDSRRVWLPHGRAPRPAELFRNPEFARSLRLIADEGPGPLYEGSLGRQIAESVQSAGGVLTLEDLSAYQPEWVSPIAVGYGNGYEFHEIPPNGQGLAALQALNIASRFDLQALGYGTADYYHALIESMKLAFVDAHAYIADMRQANVPLAGLLSPSYAAQRQALIEMDRALQPGPGDPALHGDTVYLTTADEAGNMVSWIQSLYSGFGSGLTAGTTGIQLQNRGANFSLVAGHPNEAAPGKRPYHTIIPGFITHDGDAFSSFGVMGGFMQPQGHLQVGLNMVEFDMDPQTALDAPRFYWQRNREVGLEEAIPAAVASALAARGHELVSGLYFGGGQAIIRDAATGTLVGGSEPRNDGAAVGF